MFSMFVLATSNNDNPLITYNIIAQDESGRRLLLNTSTLTNESMTDREVRDIQNKRIINIENHINAGRPLNKNHWTEIDPAQGSPAYTHLLNIGYYNK